MDSLSFLKHWRSATAKSTSPAKHAPADAINDTDTDTDDEGPFFDLEFHDKNETFQDGEDEQNLSFSTNPSADDEFFKADLLPLDSSSIVIAAGHTTDPKTQHSASLLKSATKLRVFILGLRKSKSTPVESNASKFFFVKFKLEDAPLFSRDSSSKEVADVDDAEEKTKASNSKEVVQKYLSKIKPLYVKVSKRYVGKLRFSATEEKEGEAEEHVEVKMTEKNPKLAKLRVVYERLGKSRAETAAVAAVLSPQAPPQRRDDSLIQQQDGIQSAIAHCKRSFTATSKGA